MNPNVNIIANRLSLRPPQRVSLEILAKVCDVIPANKVTRICMGHGAVDTLTPDMESAGIISVAALERAIGV